MVNDPVPIKSADVSASGDDDYSLAMSDGSPRTTKRKPDFVTPTLQWLQKLMPDNKDFGLDDWVTMVCRDHKEVLTARKKASKEGVRLSWEDITQCWEVKAGKTLDKEHLASLDRTFDTDNILVVPGKLHICLFVWQEYLTSFGRQRGYAPSQTEGQQRAQTCAGEKRAAASANHGAQIPRSFEF
jgi:hypothetical protein